MTTNQHFTRLACIICLLASAFYMYEFTLQVSVGVMTNELMRDLGLNAATLGMTSSFYYWAYTPMQVPAGLLHDRFGPRRTLTVAIFCCAMGALVFSSSTNVIHASMGRFLMGIGSAFSFSGALMLIARWFPARHFAVLSGIVQLMSSVGAIGGELPLERAINHWGWRHSMVFLAFVGVALSVVVWLIVRDFPKGQKLPAHHPLTQDKTNKPTLAMIFARKEVWMTAAYSFLIWAPIAAFAGLWGVPFLVSAYQITTAQASVAISAIWVGIGLGSPLSGWISELLRRRCVVLATCGALGIVSTISVIYCNLSMPMLYFSLFILGLAAGGQSLAFCVVRDNSHPATIGAAIGLNNMATVAGGMLVQPLIGYLVHLYWDGTMSGLTPIYSAADYRYSLFMIPACYVLATLIGWLGLRETYCKQLHAF